MVEPPQTLLVQLSMRSRDDKILRRRFSTTTSHGRGKHSKTRPLSPDFSLKSHSKTRRLSRDMSPKIYSKTRPLSGDLCSKKHSKTRLFSRYFYNWIQANRATFDKGVASPDKNFDQRRAEQMTSPRVENICTECTQSSVSTTFYPCEHAVTCEDCACSLSRCPQCKADIISIRITRNRQRYKLPHRTLVGNKRKIMDSDRANTKQLLFVGSNIEETMQLTSLLLDTFAPKSYNKDDTSTTIRRDFQRNIQYSGRSARISRSAVPCIDSEDITSLHRYDADVIVVCVSINDVNAEQSFLKWTCLLRKAHLGEIVWLLVGNRSGQEKWMGRKERLRDWLISNEQASYMLQGRFFSLVGGMYSVSPDQFLAHVISIAKINGRRCSRSIICSTSLQTYDEPSAK